MSFPSGVTTALVRFGPYVDDVGTPYEGSVTFQSSGRRVWEATGAVFLPRPVTVQLVDGAGSITLPVVDQDGWTDGVGNAVSHWTYTGTYLLESHARLPRTFVVLADGATGSIEVDLDLLTPVGSSSGVIVELPAVTSVNGMTGAVVITGTGDLDVVGDLDVTGDLDVVGRLSTAGFALPLTALVPRRTAWRPASWLQNFQTGHGWSVGTGAGSASGNANDTSDFIKGTQAVSVTTAANAQQSQIRRTGTPPVDLNGKMIRLTFKVTDVTHLDRMTFYVGTGGFTNFFQWTFHTHTTGTSQNWVQSGEWVTITLSWSDVTSASGSYSLSSNRTPSTKTGFTDMQLAVWDRGTGSVTYRLQSIELVPDTTTTFPTGVVSITFDDSWQSVYDRARPKMDALGYRGTQFTIVDYLNSGPDRLTIAELRTLKQFSGWEVSGHAYTNAAHGARYNTLTSRQVDDELRNLRAWLVTNGFDDDTFAYPGGQFSTTTDGVPIESLVGRYFAAGRSIVSETYEVLGSPMPYRLRAITGINDGSGLGGRTVASLVATGGPLDQCLQGCWLILAFHVITTGTPTDATQCSQAGFNTVMDAINARGLPVLPVGDVLRNYG